MTKYSVFIKGIEVEKGLNKQDAENMALDFEMQGCMEVDVVEAY